MRVLVTGITGFIGGHLAAQLIGEGHDVAGFGRCREGASLPWQLFEGDILALERISATIQAWTPELIFHLAGTRAGSTLGEIFDVNVIGTANVLDAARLLERAPRIIAVSSSAVYGAGEAITEQATLAPVSPYGASKAAADILTRQHFVATRADISCVRPFNVIGPGQRGDNVAAVCARQIVEAERGTRPPAVTLGPLGATRDFVDVRDAVRAMIGVARHGRPGETYNVCTGRGILVRELVNELCAAALVAVGIEERTRPSSSIDVASQVGSFAKLRSDVGWEPRYDLAQTARDTLAELRNSHS